ncbi:GNAT family N-acetyltransferase, partial [Sphingomonas sp. 66-10]
MFARTSRLTLRPWWPEDAATLTATIAHEAVAKKLARMPWPYALDDAEAFLSLPRGATEPRFAILAHDGDYPRLIGSIGLHRGEQVHELGYWLTPNAWGRGYATEA